MQLVLDPASLKALVDAIVAQLEPRLAESASRKYLSVKEFADSRSISVRTVRRHLSSGTLAFERAGRRVMIPCDAAISEAAS